MAGPETTAALTAVHQATVPTTTGPLGTVLVLTVALRAVPLREMVLTACARALGGQVMAVPTGTRRSRWTARRTKRARTRPRRGLPYRYRAPNLLLAVPAWLSRARPTHKIGEARPATGA